MRKILFLLIPFISQALFVWSAPPSRTYSYVTGNTIAANEVTTNEDNIYTYLQGGVDTIKDNSIVTADIQDSAITSAKILDGTIVTADVSAIETSVLTMATGLVGHIIRYDGSSYVPLAQGTSGQALLSQGANAEPIWGTAANLSSPDPIGDVTPNTGAFTTLSANTVSVSSSESGTPAANTIYTESIVKGWILFDGTGTISITGSFNVDSISDDGTGDYSVVWDRDFANANYAVVSTANQYCILIDSIATTGVNLLTTSDSATPTDSANISLIAIGDQ